VSGSLRDAVRAASRQLAAAGVEQADVDAVALAAHVLRTSTSDVRRLMVLGAETPPGLEDMAALVAERARRVPLQHLTGRAPFRHLELSVGPGVFVPRPETEMVAGLAVPLLRELADTERRAPVVVDLCTGSGAIALSLKHEVPAASVHAVELSDLAHAWAVRNRDDLGLDVEMVLGDATTAFAELEGEVDVVVSNPPYIPVGAVPNDPEVRDHDPHVALYGGSADGLRIPLEVASRAGGLLRDGGVLLMEHADVQGRSLPAALQATGVWTGIEDHDDLAGRPRVTRATRAPRLAP
jgi:release factor glutamine methyltransferase